MKVRTFLLENEKGQQFRLDNLDEGCFLTSPSNLGLSKKIEFQKIGQTYVEISKEDEQKSPSGTVFFKNYNKYREFIDFTEAANKLKIIYKIPYKTEEKKYYKDIILKKIDKTEKSGKWLSCPVEFTGVSLWYEENTIEYTISPIENEIRWDFIWDTTFNDNNSQNLIYQNMGHVPAPITLEMNGAVSNPIIEIYINDTLYQELRIKTTIAEYEKLIYNSKENEFAIKKIKTDGTEEELFDLDIIDFENDNVIRIPKNKTCEIRLKADNTIENAKLTIFPQYKSV